MRAKRKTKTLLKFRVENRAMRKVRGMDYFRAETEKIS
jgi:hypothetical protein